MQIANIFANLPTELPVELLQNLLTTPTVRIERIVSKGHCSATDFWYDQNQDEWILLVQGHARLEFADQNEITLQAGDYLLIPANCKHRVSYTDHDRETIWLAIYIDGCIS